MPAGEARGHLKVALSCNPSAASADVPKRGFPTEVPSARL